MRLTDLQIRKLSLENGSAKQKTYFDEGLKGFGLRVSVGGAKSFVVMYGKGRRLKTLGRYPDLSLAEARAEAKKVLGAVANATGSDEGMLPFPVAREQFLEDSRMRNKASTYEAYRRVLERYFIFTRKIGAITRQDVMEVVDKLKERRSESRHAFVAIRTMMNWAVMRGLIANSPVPPLKYKVPSRVRILTDVEIKNVWDRAVEVGYPYGAIVQLLILTGQRRGEIAGLKRSWLTENSITFPVGFCKNKREHKIPIGTLTKDIAESVYTKNELLFVARGRQTTSFAGWSKAKREFDCSLDLAPYTLHDLRRTYSSNMARLGVPVQVTEKLLNHVSGTVSGIAAVYNRYSYMEEMRQAVAIYDAHLQELLDL